MLEQINQNPTAAAILKTSEQVLPKVVTYALVALSLWLIAGAVWMWIPHPPLPVATSYSSANSSTQTSQTERADVNRLINRHLFGETKAVAKPKPTTSNTDAPETRLNLKLAGIILSDTPEMSRALIATSNGKQKSYAIGDNIDGASASVHEIHSDHIVLERSGRYETLRLQKLTTASRSTTSSSRNTSSKTVDKGVTTELKSVREQILKDPSKAGDFIRVRPVYSKGQLKGYRIYPGKDRALFRKVGLRSGDLVTSINGQGLNDPQKAFTMLSELSNASSISLELERRGRTETVSVDLGS